MRTGRVALALIAAAGVLACAAVTRPTAAAFTASNTATASYTVDKLASYFAVAAGSSTRPGGSTPIAAGDVDTQTLTFGTVPSAQAFAAVFTVRNTTSQPQPAVLSLAGATQLATPVFTSTGTSTDTIPAGATRTVSVATSPTAAGHGVGTVRLRLGSYTWLYRDYATTIDLAPQAPTALTATARAAGAIRLTWAASTTTSGLAGYDVYRRNGTGSYAKVNAAPLSATAYDDTATADGTSYTYVVRAVTTAGVTLSSVDSPVATATADATPPGKPTSIALANGGGTGSAYVNAANEASVSVTVGLPAGTVATDTVTVTLTSGSTTVTTTASGATGTITLSGIDARGLAQGAVTISASTTDAAGNVSAVATTTVQKDTEAPELSAYYSDRKSPDEDLIWGNVDSGATVKAVRISPSGGATYTAVTGWGYYAVVVGAHKNVTVTYSVTAADAAGNVSPAVTVTERTDQ
jgi:hypothetical protein